MSAIASATHIEVRAVVRYWEDSSVGGRADEDGTMIPCRVRDAWCPTIQLSDGMIVGWPDGVSASVHYKVCDDGEYWLLDAKGSRVGKWNGHYVPGSFLCHGETGYGDYIIFDVTEAGYVAQWKPPVVTGDEWEATP
jgi:hypothetical protein